MRYICVMTVRPFFDTPRDRTTQAAEGMLRRRFTVEELEAMVAAGILGEDERIELIGGEVVPIWNPILYSLIAKFGSRI